MNTVRALTPSPATKPENASDLTLSANTVERALSFVSHAMAAPFVSKAHLDLVHLDWSDGVDALGRHEWAATATDGHRLARFTTSDAAMFDTHPHRASLPSWIVAWCAASSGNLTIRTRGGRTELVLSGYGTFRPDLPPFVEWSACVAGLRHSSTTPVVYSRSATEVRRLVQFVSDGRRDHTKDAPVFMVPGDGRAWGLSFDATPTAEPFVFGGKPHAVPFPSRYLIDALKPLARAAKDGDNATVDARWSSRLDPVVFTAPNRLSIVMPCRPAAD